MSWTTLEAPSENIQLTAVRRRNRSNRARSAGAYLVVLFVGLLVGALAYKRLYQPYFGVGWACFLMLLAAWWRFPKVALGATIFCALAGDTVTVAWWPFAKNLSSRESIMYVSDAVAFTPLEITLVWALTVTAYRNVGAFGRPFRSTSLVAPFVAFVGLTMFALLRGLGSGGDTRAALFEVRPLLLLPLVYLLIASVCTSTVDYRRMFAAALAAVVVQSLFSLQYFQDLSPIERDVLDSLNEHGSAISMNLLFMTTITALAYRGVSASVRVTLAVACVPVLFVYIIAQRRAAVIALCIAFILFAVMIFWRQRRTFWKVVPVVTVVSIAYLGAFWNSQSSAAFPAAAIKTVIASDQASAEDLSSDLYRQVEKLNLSATVRSSPLVGIGFGHPFSRPYQLADISFFEFNAYLPHNSVIWIWIKMGFGGLVAFLYIMVRATIDGAERARREVRGMNAVTALNAVLFIAMYAVFLYVEVGWEARNVVLLALSLGLCTGHLETRTRAAPAQRTSPGSMGAPVHSG